VNVFYKQYMKTNTKTPMKGVCVNRVVRHSLGFLQKYSEGDGDVVFRNVPCSKGSMSTIHRHLFLASPPPPFGA